MLDTQEFGNFLQSVGLSDFVGVPCSYLSPLINYAINENCFIMSNNEGDAVAIASGISLVRHKHSVLSESCGSSEKSLRSFMSNKLPCDFSHNPQASSQALECQESFPSKSLDSEISESEIQINAATPNSNSKILSEKLPQRASANETHLGVRRSEAEVRCGDLSPKRSFFRKAELLRYGVVLMQNSGLSNALSPLTSLNHTFEIPILGFVSLRGERDSNGKNTDEPQHELLGIITDKLLETCQIHYAFLDSDMERAKEQVQDALKILGENKSFFFVVRDKTFSKVKLEQHSVLSDKSGSASPCSLQRTPSASHSQGSHNPKNSSQALECQESLSSESLDSEISESEMQTNALVPNSNSKIFDEKCGLQGKSQGSYLSGNDRRDFSQLPHLSPKAELPPLPTRLEALTILHTLALKSQALLLATTGKCGRELYEIADTPNQLYMVGSMGCVSSLALGISLKTNQKVIAIDGDSALLMRLGALSTNAYYANTHNKGNFCHVLLDNESHDSTGGQFNLSPFVDFSAIAKHCGYANVYEARSLEEFEECVKVFLDSEISESSTQTNAHTQNSNSKILSENTGESAAGFLGDFKGCQGGGEGSLVNINDRADNADSLMEPKAKSTLAKSGKKPTQGATFIYLKIAKGSKDNLGRPKITPKEVARRLEGYINSYNKTDNADFPKSRESNCKESK